jgi:hypothetical protein
VKTQTEFFQAHAVDGKLSDEHTAQMLNLPEGESGIQSPQSGTPEPTVAPVATPEPTAPPAETPAPTAEPVILAKDGVHTIEYQKLVDAREEARAAKARADALEAENQALKSTAATPATTPAPTVPPVSTDVDFGDFSDEAVAKGILAAVEKRVAELLPVKVAEALAPLERRAAEDIATKHWTTLYTAHPNMDAMLESKELEGWIAGKPSYEQAAIRAVLDGGTTSQVVEVFDSFVKATGKAAEATPQTTPAPTPDPAAAAQAAIDKVKAGAPSSLSEIPGSTAHHDEADAMREMSPTALMKKFDGKSPEQIAALMSKAL